jgi:hypothetical protein
MPSPIGRRIKSALRNRRLMATVATAASLSAGADIAPRPVIVNEQPRPPIVNRMPVRPPDRPDAGTASPDAGTKGADQGVIRLQGSTKKR